MVTKLKESTHHGMAVSSNEGKSYSGYQHDRDRDVMLGLLILFHHDFADRPTR